MTNPYAIYVNCDGAMDYSPNNPGGIGFIISFPEPVQLEPISISRGIYQNGNIEMLELEALIQGFKEMRKVYEEHKNILFRVNQIIFVTDRYHLNDNEKTSAYTISAWRKNRWRNFENKPIKNHKLLDELDKERQKLSKATRMKISIEYRSRKKNRGADKLAKAGKKQGLLNNKLWKKGQKIGKRKFDGPEIKYNVLTPGMMLQINVFRKDPVQHQWEVWGEIVQPPYLGNKLKIYADDIISAQLKRGNEYSIKIEKVFRYHIHIDGDTIINKKHPPLNNQEEE